MLEGRSAGGYMLLSRQPVSPVGQPAIHKRGTRRRGMGLSLGWGWEMGDAGGLGNDGWRGYGFKVKHTKHTVV